MSSHNAMVRVMDWQYRGCRFECYKILLMKLQQYGGADVHKAWLTTMAHFSTEP